eukprot:TRINITY_DN4101_c0_g2_i5.p1 TRINITY_DN4101_c0_g2~~TRINITY_DN4101_c0_g2_i5.p1  ORF type:complete len:1903 (-),score=320.30 TRINITY_DN4101_c0_g2_i5:75-5783(-)
MIKDAAGTSHSCNTSSPVISGDWGTKAGPNITKIVASDPDNKDAIYGAQDIISVYFSENTNTPAASTKAQVDALFNFSQTIGVNYAGSWVNPALLVINITSPSVISPTFSLTMAVKLAANLRNAASTSLPSTNRSPSLTGNWGTLAGPAVTSLVASDPNDNSDAVYSVNDIITITFNMATNCPIITSKALVDSYFSFTQVLGNDYYGVWPANDTCVIEVLDILYCTPPQIGVMNVTATGIYDATYISLPSSSTFGPITGNWGTLAGPTIKSAIAYDPDNMDSFYSNGDSLTILFTTATNMPLLSSVAIINSVFSFSSPLGNSYTAAWGPTADNLTITIVDKGTAVVPLDGSYLISLKTAQTLIKDAALIALYSQGSAALTGDWGTLAGPAITSFVANDPDDRDGNFSALDSVTIGFDVATNTPAVASKALIDSLLSFTQSIGTSYNATWLDANTLLITILTPGTASPGIGALRCTVIGALYNSALTSLKSNSTSGTLTGDWGLGPLCTFTTCATCVANSTCGWCAESQRCFEGNSVGPLFTTCGNWEYTSCHTCGHTTCNTCIGDTYCGWCLDSGCNRGNTTVSFTSPCSSYSKTTCPGITTNPTTLNSTSEAGGFVTFGVILQYAPTTTVTVNVYSTDLTEGTVSPSSLTFSAANWNSYQTIIVTGVDDSIIDGTVAYLIFFNITTTDPAFSGVKPASLAVSNTDNDVAGLVTACCTGNGGLTSENGTSTSLQASLQCQPAQTVSLTVTATPATECAVVPTTLSFVPATWNTKQNIVITGVDDYFVDGTQNCTVVLKSSSTDTSFNNLVATVKVANLDNDVAGFQILHTPVSTSENGAADYVTIAVMSQPISDVSITCFSNDTSEGALVSSTITFLSASWSVHKNLTIVGQDDITADGNIVYSVYCNPAVCASSDYSGRTLPSWTLINIDNDTPGVTITPISLVTYEATTSIFASFKSVLNTAPSQTVSITLNISDATEGALAVTSPLVFTTSNWGTPQTINIVGVDDSVVDGNVTYQLTVASVSADPNYNGIAITGSPFTLVNVDNDVPGLYAKNGTALVTTEAGATGTIAVHLFSQPTSTVTVPVTSNDISEGIVSPALLAFDSTNWATSQTITITGVDDSVVDGNIVYSVTVGPSTSADSLYNGRSAVFLFTNVDDDVLGLKVTLANSTTCTNEAGDKLVFYVSLGSQPTASVTFQLSTNDTTEGVVTPSALTFAVATWNALQTVVVTGQDDAYADGTINYRVTAGPSASADPQYNAVTFSSYFPTLCNFDNDVAALVISPPTSNTSESGQSASFTFHLGSMPFFSLSIPIVVSDPTEGQLTSPASPVLVAPAAWTSVYNVTVRGLDDLVDDGNVPYTVTLGPVTAQSGTDPYYSGKSWTISLYNVDNDASGLTVTPSSIVTTEGGGSATFSLVLQSQPTASVVVPITSLQSSEITCVPSSIQFTAADWNTASSIICTGVDDQVVDGNQPVLIRVGPTVSADPNYQSLVVNVSATNTDNDHAGLVVSVTAGVTSENGTSCNLPVHLATIPQTGEVVVVNAVSSRSLEGVVVSAALAFSAATWNVNQNVVVQGVDGDSVADGPQAYFVTLSTSSTIMSSLYNNFTMQIAMTNLDNDVPGLVLSNVASKTTSEDGTLKVTFTVTLSSQPLAQVNVPVTVSDPTEGSSSVALISFLPTSWNTPRVVVISGVNDYVEDGNQTYTVTLGPTNSSDPFYAGKFTTVLTLVNVDDDKAGISISPSGYVQLTSEAGMNVTFTVHMMTQPGAAVTLHAMSSDTTEGVVSPATIVFDTTNWNVTRHFTVAGVDDTVADGPIFYNVTLRVTTPDPVYSHMWNTSVIELVNVDNEFNDPFEVTAISSNTTESGGICTFWVVLSKPPTTDYYVYLDSTDITEGVRVSAVYT